MTSFRPRRWRPQSSDVPTSFSSTERGGYGDYGRQLRADSFGFVRSRGGMTRAVTSGVTDRWTDRGRELHAAIAAAYRELVPMYEQQAQKRRNFVLFRDAGRRTA